MEIRDPVKKIDMKECSFWFLNEQIPLEDYEGTVVIEGDLSGIAETSFAGKLYVKGNLIMSGSLSAEEIEVEGNLEISDGFAGITATSIVVKGNIVVGGDLELSGDLTCKSLTAKDTESICIDGNLQCENISCMDIEIGGDVKATTIDARSITCQGDLICQDIKVFKSVDVFNDLDCKMIYGDMQIKDHECDPDITVHGDMEVDLFLKAKTISVDGSFNVGEEIHCGKIRIGF